MEMRKVNRIDFDPSQQSVKTEDMVGIEVRDKESLD